MTTDLDRLIEAVEAGRDLFPANFPLDFPKRQWALRASEGSLGAAVALLDALLPGWHWRLDTGSGFDAPYAAVFTGPTAPVDIQCDADNDVPARALLLATLRAYRSMRKGG